VDEPNFRVAPLDRADLAPERERASRGLDVARERTCHLGELDDARVRRVQSRQAAHVRLDLAQLVGVEPAQALDAVRAPAALELVEPRQLTLARCDDQLADPHRADTGVLAVGVQLARTLHAQPRFQRTRRVVDAGVDHAAVRSCLPAADKWCAIEHHNALARPAPK
jgi:hypothetical protein